MTENAAAERRRQDLARLQELCARSAGRMRVLETTGDPLRELTVELRCKTAPSAQYPALVQQATRVRVQLPVRYPFETPLVQVTTPIYHPNVYSSGRVCLGTKWLPTEGLDQLFRRLVQIVTFDPELTNPASPANSDAARWYSTARTRHPQAFPSDSLDLSAEAAPRRPVQFRDVPAEAPPSRLVACRSCGVQNRVPAGVREARCGRCRQALS